MGLRPNWQGLSLLRGDKISGRCGADCNWKRAQDGLQDDCGSVSPSRWQKSTGKRQQSDVSSTVRRASAWAKTQQAARGSVLDEVLGKESA